MITKLQQKWHTTQFKFQNEMDTDLLLTLNALRQGARKLKLTWENKWVKRHQNKVKHNEHLTTIEQINVDMDELAASTHEMGGNWCANTCVPVLPGE